jgi:hypothetical protein
MAEAVPLPADNEKLVNKAETVPNPSLAEKDEIEGKDAAAVKTPRTDVFREGIKLREHWYAGPWSSRVA